MSQNAFETKGGKKKGKIKLKSVNIRQPSYLIFQTARKQIATD